MNIALTCKENSVPQGAITLPASKSISNRVLVIQKLAGGNLPVENLAVCDDTELMLQALQSEGNYFDVGHAGTAMRFLTALLAQKPGNWEITGSERMKHRPIAVLVETLNQLGAHIEYKGSCGYPPLGIEGKSLAGGIVEMAASVSSQYISALMLIAPYMEKGLTIRLKGKVVSPAYIEMTVRLMKAFGAKVYWEREEIWISPQPYRSMAYAVEADWSAASYFYELLAIAEAGELYLPGLKSEDLQGDARQVSVWEQLGVHTIYEPKGVRICKRKCRLTALEFDFIRMPDLVQSFAVACCLKNIPFVFQGVETLRIKETDRIQALIEELAKLGYHLQAKGDNELRWEGKRRKPEAFPVIETYQDHRMAMAFAPAVLKHPHMVIVDKEVVSKSFPHYWEELQKACPVEYKDLKS